MSTRKPGECTKIGLRISRPQNLQKCTKRGTAHSLDLCSSVAEDTSCRTPLSILSCRPRPWSSLQQSKGKENEHDNMRNS